ncbi:MAG: tyrosine recombinase [Proteobacteria bacterium]|nr:tyrosine recombinase [Pseudomonadota bacterium]
MDPLIELFLNHLKIDRGSSMNTIQAYQRDLLQFESAGALPLAKRKEKDIQNHLAALKRKNQESTSVARKISALRQFYRFLLREKVIEDDPTLFVATPVHRKRLPKALNESMLTALLRAADEGLPYEGDLAPTLKLRDKTMIYLLYATGLRVSELLSVQSRRVDAEAGLLRVMGKRSKERIIPFPPVVSGLLHEYRKTARPKLKPSIDTLFLGQNGKPLTRQAFWKTLGRLASLAGISKIHPHMLRHTFATDLLKSGMNLRVLQNLLGHADLQTTEVYTHVVPERLKEVVRRYHPRGKKE